MATPDLNLKNKLINDPFKNIGDPFTTNNMKQYQKLFIFLGTIVFLLVGLSTLPNLFSFREVTCSEYSKCPDDGPNKFSICVKITDFAGKQSILPIDSPSDTLGTVQKCYTDGTSVTLSEPLDITLPLLVWYVGFLLLMIVIDQFFTPDDISPARTEKIIDILKIIILVVFVAYLILISGAKIYYEGAAPAREVTCVKYVSDGIYEPVDKVGWIDRSGKEKVSLLGKFPLQPNKLPATCFDLTDKVIFYDPNGIYIILTLIGIAIGVTCLWWIDSLKHPNDTRSNEVATTQNPTSSEATRLIPAQV
ncbi:MAG: hypothetical protein Hyperionvirus40_2 [Hyperionvirus sp.]|uniref:Uncharacterized protein n=1 Tax=Hyperionvirus sp. TaxID=2487770 RepID=A0A3G5AC21_9VIRU|nr:MAG: hypothetical protein Hyperionvirus40_2 [Hyperionvirus sp.]